jgi:hypothetical protein
VTRERRRGSARCLTGHRPRPARLEAAATTATHGDDPPRGRDRGPTTPHARDPQTAVAIAIDRQERRVPTTAHQTSWRTRVGPQFAARRAARRQLLEIHVARRRAANGPPIGLRQARLETKARATEARDPRMSQGVRMRGGGRRHRPTPRPPRDRGTDRVCARRACPTPAIDVTRTSPICARLSPRLDRRPDALSPGEEHARSPNADEPCSRLTDHHGQHQRPPAPVAPRSERRLIELSRPPRRRSPRTIVADRQHQDARRRRPQPRLAHQTSAPRGRRRCATE